MIYGLGISENDEGYIELYTNKTEELERNRRELEEHDGYQSFDHSSYYYMQNHHPEGYMPEGNPGYAYNPQPIMHPNPPMPPMGFNPSMGAGMPQNHYAVSPNPMEYSEDDGSKPPPPHPLDMPYNGQYQMPRHPTGTGQPEEYHNYGNSY